METKGNKVRFIGEQVSEGKSQKGGKEVFTGEPRSKRKEGWMDEWRHGGEEE